MLVLKDQPVRFAFQDECRGRACQGQHGEHRHRCYDNPPLPGLRSFFRELALEDLAFLAFTTLLARPDDQGHQHVVGDLQAIEAAVFLHVEQAPVDQRVKDGRGVGDTLADERCLGILGGHPMTVAAISAGSPVYVAVVSRLMTGARLERGFWGATVLTLIGAGIAIVGRSKALAAAGGPLPGAALQPQGGELLVVLGICSWTAYSILAQKWFPPATPQLRRTWLTTVWALPWLFGFWALARLVGLVGEPNLSPAPLPVLQLMIAAVFCTALATVAWNTGVNRLGIQTGGMWQNTVPVFAVLIGLLFFGVQPLPEQILGGAIVLTGVLYMQWQRSPGRQKSPVPTPTAKH